MNPRSRPTPVAHVDEVPEAGSFVTVDAAGSPLLVVRQDDRSVRVLSNVCRHRGAQVETERSGRRKMFSCPYHRWCYGRTGALRTAPFDDGFVGVPAADRALLRRASTEAGGLVWVVPDASAAPDVADASALDGTTLLRTAVVPVPRPWTEVEGFVRRGRTEIAPGTYLAANGGWVELVAVRPAGPHLDHTAVAAWLLANGQGVVPDEVRRSWADWTALKVAR